MCITHLESEKKLFTTYQARGSLFQFQWLTIWRNPLQIFRHHRAIPLKLILETT